MGERKCSGRPTGRPDGRAHSMTRKLIGQLISSDWPMSGCARCLFAPPSERLLGRLFVRPLERCRRIYMQMCSASKLRQKRQ